ncbi:MAG: hypothetical protein HY369_03315 [Candidatus Aenigmarchaeota archaeon]|nr:hypothetical protein [Candidatus Aenigmarchaeota archaeon]
MRWLFLLPVVLISGCTVPFIGIDVPWGNTISLENDVIVITKLTAIPDKATPPQAIRLLATIQNQGQREFGTGPDAITTSAIPIVVDLYDFCEGLFEKVEVTCPDQVPHEGTTCEIKELLPKESREVSWTLTPSPDTKLVTPCTLKISASYPYETSGLTTVHFINSDEYNRQLDQGTFVPKSSTVSLGDGPVKAWFEVKDQQPVPAAPTPGDSVIPVSLMIENKGLGFVRELPDGTGQVKLVATNIFSPPFSAKVDGCSFAVNQGIRLIQDERSLPCHITQPADEDILKETTRQLTVDISYVYEFRDDIKVTVEAPFEV